VSRDDAIAEYLPYAKKRGYWWAHRYPFLKEDILATAMLTLVQVFEGCPSPQYPKALLSKAIGNAVIDLLRNNNLIHVPKAEIARRLKAEEPLIRILHLEDDPIRKTEPIWMGLQVEDLLRRLTERERSILDLKIQGFSYVEISAQTGIDKSYVRRIIQGIQCKIENFSCSPRHSTPENMGSEAGS